MIERKMQPGDIADIYDKDKNYLLSSDELVDVIKNFTGYELNQQEKYILVENIKKVTGVTGMRSELKREEITKLFDMVEIPPVAPKAQEKDGGVISKKLTDQVGKS